MAGVASKLRRTMCLKNEVDDEAVFEFKIRKGDRLYSTYVRYVKYKATIQQSEINPFVTNSSIQPCTKKSIEKIVDIIESFKTTANCVKCRSD